MFRFPTPNQYYRALRYHEPVYIPGWRPLSPYREIFWGLSGLVILVIILFTIFRVQAVTSYSPTLVVDSGNQPWSYQIPETWNVATDNLPEDMESLVSQLNLTEEGRVIVDRTHPIFGSPEEVATFCGESYTEGAVILGCWMNSNGQESIIIQNAKSSDYVNVGSTPHVTLAHELLHSIYQDVTYQDKQTIFQDLVAEYPELYKEIGSLGYFSLEIDDEMFTRVGSEKTSGPESATAIYAKYFHAWQGNAPVTASTPTSDATTSNPCAPLVCGEMSFVSRVVDGDTIEVNHDATNIRIVGVNTPESVDPSKPVECFGPEASAYLQNLLVGQNVYLVVDTIQPTNDIYGRPLRNVFLADGTNVAYEIIVNGYGRATDYGGNAFTDLYDSAEVEAQTKKVGIWGVCQ